MTLHGYVRRDGRVGARNRLLVLPSVICATRVAAEVAERAGGISITHQHGCSQIGDDGILTGNAFEGIASNPNVGGSIVVSLGCETILGSRVADSIASNGGLVRFVGIQDSGGTDAAEEAGAVAAAELRPLIERIPRSPISVDELVVGVELSRVSALARGFVADAVRQGATVLIGAEALPFLPDPPSAQRSFAFGKRVRRRGLMILEDAGRGAEQHVAFAAAGAQVIVAFPGERDGAVGSPICPVVSVGGSALHAALGDDFDMNESRTVHELWALVSEVFGGRASRLEELGLSAFALRRLERTM